MGVTVGVGVGVEVGYGRVTVDGTRFFPEHPLREMAPWTIGSILNIVLVDELLDVNHGMDHLMESQDMLLPIHPQLPAGLTAQTPSVQLDKRMLPTAPNEAVPIIVLGLPSFVLPALRLRKWYNTMLPTSPLPLRGPKRGRKCYVTRAFSGVPNAKCGDRNPQSSYTAYSILGTVHKGTICGGKKPKKVGIATKIGGKGCIGVYVT